MSLNQRLKLKRDVKKIEKDYPKPSIAVGVIYALLLCVFYDESRR